MSLEHYGVISCDIKKPDPISETHLKNSRYIQDTRSGSYILSLRMSAVRSEKDQPITSLISYFPAGLPARNLAASMAPLPKIALE